jgi:hypothetical protein
MPFMAPALPYIGTAAAAWAGSKLAGGGGDGDDDSDLQAQQMWQLGQPTRERQMHLWNQAEQYAATDPFQSQYGGAAAMPGMGAMSQRGQQYLTNQILGPGAYGAGWTDPNDPTDAVQNLGFTDYQRPTEAAPSPGWSYMPKGPDAVGREQFRDGRYIPPTRYSDKGYDDDFYSDDPWDTPSPYTSPTPYYDPYDDDPWGDDPYDDDPWGSNKGATFGAGVQLARSPFTPTAPFEQQMGLQAAPQEQQTYGLMQEQIARGQRQWQQQVPDGRYIPPRLQEPGEPIRMPTRGYVQGRGGMGAPIRVPARVGLLGPGDEAGSPAVGIGEMEMGRLATRRMLEEGGPSTLGYDRFLPERTDPVTGVVTPAGWREQAQAGIGETPGFERDATGNLVPIEGFGWSGVELEGPTIDPATGLPIPGTGYRPSYDAIRGEVTDGVRATPFGVTERDPFTFGSIDPATGEPRVDPETGFPIGDVPAVTQRLISEQTGYGTTAYGEDGVALTEEQRALSQIGQAERPGQVYDPLTDTYTPAAVAERITGGDIPGLGQFRDPVTGELTDVMTPDAVTIDPVTGQATEAVGGVAAGEFGGASFLGGPAIQDYMNVAGTEAAVTQARQDYEIALNREKARQAQVGAFGARGTVEEAGLIEAQERNIAQIRGAGYERAAELMSQDVARRQQAGLQTQQLGAQTGLAGQALEAQRRESDAARAQQAVLAGQQLGTQAAMQTQQLGFQGGMQAQQLGQQANIRQAELDMEAARANQATALTSGSQTQQIESARQMRQAELNLQRQQQTQQLGLQAGMQQAGFGQQAAIRQTELDIQREQATQGLGAEAFMQQQQLGQQAAMATASNALAAARADQQAALASGNQAAALEAARRAQGAQAQIDVASQAQRLGAGAAGQQVQLEAVRRQRLSEMGLQAGGMGMDAQAQFRQQQMAAAQQLADIGGMRQGATFGAAGQLAGMGAQQEQARRQQMAWDYEQWLRGQQGGAESLALTQSLMPGAQQWQYGRKPSTAGQIGGGLLSAAGIAADIYKTSKTSDIRLKENIELVGNKNGFNIYEFNYLDMPTRYRGVMAHEVARTRPDAVIARDGVLLVNYDAIDIQMESV